MKGEPIVVLLVEDDAAHAEIVRRNFTDCRLANRMMHVDNGQAALDYLHHQSEFSDHADSPRPGIILLDLRLPKVNGLEVLQHIKTNPEFSSIPVVVLTTSKAEQDMVKAYALHANSYLVKPVDFTKFTELMTTFGFYWVAWNQYPDWSE
ncbi:MAG: response regulator [bacterium]